jgi:hypothetical protein
VTAALFTAVGFAIAAFLTTFDEALAGEYQR